MSLGFEQMQEITVTVGHTSVADQADLTEATITVNGQSVTGLSGSFWLPAGTYDITVTPSETDTGNGWAEGSGSVSVPDADGAVTVPLTQTDLTPDDTSTPAAETTTAPPDPTSTPSP